MMAAVVPGAATDPSRGEVRQRLLSELLDAVKQCQIRFGGRTELATESDSRVVILCRSLEAALSHGLRLRPLTKNNSALRHVTDIVSSSLHLGKTTGEDQQVFWHCVREHLTRHEYERYLVLKNVWTDVGRGRAWLRSSLNEHSLERYLHCLLGSTVLLNVFYEDWAFVLDQERSSMLPVMAAGLGSILFAINIDNSDFNSHGRHIGGGVEPVVYPSAKSEPIIMPADIDNSAKRNPEQRRRKRVPAHIISFDDTEDKTDVSGSVSAPATCLNSPTSMSLKENVIPTVAPQNVGETQTVKDIHIEVTRPKDIKLVKTSQPAIETAKMNTKHKNVITHESRRSSVSSLHASQTLTPINNLSVGELIPVSVSDEAHSEEDSLSVPSYSEDTDCAAAALLATQKLLETNSVDFSTQDSNSVINKTAQDLHTAPTGEVREALVTLLAKKEELFAEVRALKRLLEQEQDESARLQAELAEEKRQCKERVERLETRIQSLLRENELLKLQLRKYVGAVQMLKRDGTRAHEALASLESFQPRDGSLYPDYHHEAREYEKKLIQVAEMHGELMEFNDRLHKLLQQKDVALRRLRDELVDLRGPLPDDGITSDDDVSITSDYDNSSLCAAARALVNIWIPSAFLTGGSSDIHHVYQVFIRIRDDEWNIYRRYAQFYALHKELKKRDSIVNTFDFPPKKTIGNKDSRFVEERRRRLQHYLRCVMNHLVQTNTDLATVPDKELLVNLIPFFGETCNADERSRRKRASSRNPFSRLTRGSGENNSNSPQYTGL